MEPVSCKYCNEPDLVWESYNYDGKTKWRLINLNGQKHLCPKTNVGDIAAGARNLAHKLLKFADNYDIYSKYNQKDVSEIQRILKFSVYINEETYVRNDQEAVQKKR